MFGCGSLRLFIGAWVLGCAVMMLGGCDPILLRVGPADNTVLYEGAVLVRRTVGNRVADDLSVPATRPGFAPADLTDGLFLQARTHDDWRGNPDELRGAIANQVSARIHEICAGPPSPLRAELCRTGDSGASQALADLCIEVGPLTRRVGFGPAYTPPTASGRGQPRFPLCPLSVHVQPETLVFDGVPLSEPEPDGVGRLWSRSAILNVFNNSLFPIVVANLVAPSPNFRVVRNFPGACTIEPLPPAGRCALGIEAAAGYVGTLRLAGDGYASETLTVSIAGDRMTTVPLVARTSIAYGRIAFSASCTRVTFEGRSCAAERIELSTSGPADAYLSRRQVTSGSFRLVARRGTSFENPPIAPEEGVYIRPGRPVTLFVIGCSGPLDTGTQIGTQTNDQRELTFSPLMPCS